MKQLEFTPEEMNRVVYQIQEAERKHELNKLAIEKNEDKRKAMFAQIKSNIISSTRCSNAQAETDALQSKEWKAYLVEYYQEAEKLIEPKIKFNHLMRVLDAIDRGMSFNQTLVKKGIMDGGK